MGKTKDLVPEPNQQDLYYRKIQQEQFDRQEFEEYVAEKKRLQEQEQGKEVPIVKVLREEEEEVKILGKLNKLQTIVRKNILLIKRAAKPYWL